MASDHVILPLSATDPAVFLRAYMEASNDADIEIRSAKDDQGRDFIVVSIDAKQFAVSVSLARKVASFLEVMLAQFAGAPEVDGFPNLILGLRAAADKIEPASRPSQDGGRDGE